MNAEGNRKCGGEGCDGLTTLAHNAWQKTKDFDQDIVSAMEEVDKLSKMVSDPLNISNSNTSVTTKQLVSFIIDRLLYIQVSEAKVKADEAKLNAQEVLQKTNETKKRVDDSNEELRRLIKQIRDFLTRTLMTSKVFQIKI